MLGSLLTKIINGLSNIELVHVPHSRWPLPLQHYSQPRPLRIAVLDASFNPPTFAHLALINSLRPTHNNGTEYDAKLLLLSVRNADKSLKPTDATYTQRLQMMHLLAQHVHPPSSVAIGVINEPTFIGKSTLLLEFLKSRSSPTLSTTSDLPDFELSFILGLDTLERLVAPRYYPSQGAMLASLRHFFSPTEENSLVVCARRKLPDDTVQQEDKLALAQEFINAGRVLMIDIGEDESTYSSTAVRTVIKELGLGEDGQVLWRKYVPSDVADYIVNEGLYIELENRECVWPRLN